MKVIKSSMKKWWKKKEPSLTRIKYIAYIRLFHSQSNKKSLNLLPVIAENS